jgi:hypothetical protein
MANDAADPGMRERLLGPAWLEIAGYLEREAAEYDELLRALARHFQAVRGFSALRAQRVQWLHFIGGVNPCAASPCAC